MAIGNLAAANPQGANAAAAAKDAMGSMEDGDSLIGGTIDATRAEGDATPDQESASIEEIAAEGESTNEGEAKADDAGDVKPDEKAEGDEAKAGDEAPAIGEEEHEVNGETKKINFADPKVRKQLVHAAFQRKAFQARADKAEARVKTLETEFGAKAADFDKLNDAWKSGGDDRVASLKALVKSLTGAGGEGLIKDLVKAERAQEELVAKMSPAEREAHKERQEKETAQRALADERAKVAAERESSRAESERLAIEARQSVFDEEFEAVSFHGRVADAAVAERLDRQVFAAAQMDLAEAFEKAKADGVDPSKLNVRKLVRDSLKAHAEVHKGLIRAKVKDGVKEATDNAKANATSKAQAVMASSNSGGAKGAKAKGLKAAEETIATQGITAALRQARRG